MSGYRWGAALSAPAVWLLLMLAGCSDQGSAPSAGLLLPMEQRPFAPQIQAEGWLNGFAPSQASLEGKVRVIDVWAYW